MANGNEEVGEDGGPLETDTKGKGKGDLFTRLLKGASEKERRESPDGTLG